jgi:hypothetical protein
VGPNHHFSGQDPASFGSSHCKEFEKKFKGKGCKTRLSPKTDIEFYNKIK